MRSMRQLVWKLLIPPQCVRPYEVDGLQTSNPELDRQTDTRKRIRVRQVGSR